MEYVSDAILWALILSHENNNRTRRSEKTLQVEDPSVRIMVHCVDPAIAAWTQLRAAFRLYLTISSMSKSSASTAQVLLRLVSTQISTELWNLYLSFRG